MTDLKRVFGSNWILWSKRHIFKVEIFYSNQMKWGNPYVIKLNIRSRQFSGLS